MQTEGIVRELPKGLINWYEFNKGSKALYVKVTGDDFDSLEDALVSTDLDVDTVSLAELETNEKSLEQSKDEKAERKSVTYDYIVMVGALERSKCPEELLRMLRAMLSPNGKLLLGVDNRLGIRYFCGDRDVFTGRNFDSIENYTRINLTDKDQLEGRSYARAEIAQMLENAGFSQYRFYSVLPELCRPQVLFAEDYLPEEELEVRIFPQYNYPDTVFLEEERLYTTLIQNGLFHAMANGYLVECPLDDNFSNVKQVTVSMDRGAEDALHTIIRRDNKVEKKAVYPEGCKKLKTLMSNTLDLKQHGVNVIDAELKESSYVMPYVKGVAVTDYFRQLLCTDKVLFVKELDRFWEIIKNSSEHVPYEEVNWEQFDPDWQKRKADDPNKDKWKNIAFGTEEEKKNLGIILRRGYIDLVSLNCFFVDGDFVFYDQEFYVENLPVNVILLRTIDFIYRGNAQMEMLLPKKELMERYYLNEYQELWRRFVGCFMTKLRNETELSSYHKTYRRDIGVVNSNRQKMNYSADEYERLFRDIFHGTEGRQIYLFGSGNFTKKFLSQFGDDYEVAGILDNNSDKWGTELSGIRIYSPEILRTLQDGSYKVIVCIKNYVSVLRQLKELGVKDYAVYDSNLKYPRKPKAVMTTPESESQAPKKYHVGYIAGVFDLFHVGHLNMFKRAKEQCDYLIVGVVSDESVMNSKKTMPYIPFEERIEMVRSCRYVDEAVAIPPEYGDTDEAYRRYQFDVQFSGSDYADDPRWLAKKVFLEKQGADMVFFPYTQSTSSTKLKALIEKGLL